MNESRFFYFLCNEGSERFLKEEIRLFYPGLKFSYSTKGFVTFKANKDIKTHHLNPVFSRHFGEFIKRGTEEELKLEFEKIKGPKFQYNLRGEVVRKDLFSPGECIHELIEVKPNEFYLGKFLVDSEFAQFPGGWPKVELDEKSPSRAYLKILEGIAKLNVQLSPGDTALEIGSSPGGATYALLKNGISVIGVDPGEMHPICFEFLNFSHHRVSVQDFTTKKLTKKIDWLLVDMNLAPEASINEIGKIFEAIKSDFQGAFITLKMTKFSLVQRLPFYSKLISRMGLKVVLMTQLPSHKQEFLMFVQKNNS